MLLHKRLILITTSWIIICLSIACMAADTAKNPQPSISARPTLAVGVTFDQHGRLWLAKVENKRLLISWSDDLGKHFSQPTLVTPEAENIGADGENRPKITVTHDGTILLTWTQLVPAPPTSNIRFAGNIRFARSTDGGKTFSAPITLNDDSKILSHRFESLLTDGRGNVAVAWLDARDREFARENNENFTGISIYFTRSADNGATFSTNQRFAQHTCECCRIAAAWSKSGPLIFWRNIFGKNTRDFALANLDSGKLQRVTDDDWEIDGCPHHGGDLAIGENDLRHLVWFTNSKNRQGLFYRHMSGELLSTPISLGDTDKQPSHPSAAASGRKVLLTWREFDGENHLARAMQSDDNGSNWSRPITLASTAQAADYPIPVFQDDQRAWVVWHTAAEGIRVLTANAHHQHQN